MCARFTVLSDTPIASAIAGCVIPLSRSSTIWMRWHCSARPFPSQRCLQPPHLAFGAFDHLFPPNQMDEANHTPRPENNSHSDLRSHATANLSIQSAMEVVLEVAVTGRLCYPVNLTVRIELTAVACISGATCDVFRPCLLYTSDAADDLLCVD